MGGGETQEQGQEAGGGETGECGGGETQEQGQEAGEKREKKRQNLKKLDLKCTMAVNSDQLFDCILNTYWMKLYMKRQRKNGKEVYFVI